jgi:hypothetical protein
MCFYVPTAGVIYQVLHYLLALRELGYDARYVEDCGRWVYDQRLGRISPDADANVRIVASVFEHYGFAESWAFRGDYEGGRCYGMSEGAVLRLYREADALLNVTGAQTIGEAQLACPRRIYIESDPFASQVKVAHGDATEIARLAAHDTHFTFGENIGAPDCLTPALRFTWLPTRQPVALDLWDTRGNADFERAAYTTITTWKNVTDGLEYQGDIYYWQKHREFETFIDLPRHRKTRFEIAAGLDDETSGRLSRAGWRTTPMDGTEDVDTYRNYIQNSRAEFTVARDQYVRPRTGWFSDRSACYLAAGRPVITQETGFSKFIPTGNGLFAFSDMDGILAAVDTIESDYQSHSRAAREIAKEFFAGEVVVKSLLDRAGL